MTEQHSHLPELDAFTIAAIELFDPGHQQLTNRTKPMHADIETTDIAPQNKMPRIRKPRPEQTQIPGTERVCIAEVERAAIDYRSVRDERMALTKLETTARDRLLATMTEHDVTLYRYTDGENEDITVEVKTSSKVRVRKTDGASDDGDE